MLKVEYLVFCEEIEQTQIGPSLLRTFDALYTSGFPAKKQEFIALIKIRSHGKELANDRSELELVVEFEEQIIFQRNLVFESMSLDVNHSVDVEMDFQDMEFKKHGLYYFKIQEGVNTQVVSTLLVAPLQERIER